MTVFDVLSESRQVGLTLRAKDNGKLGFKPERLCSPELRKRLRAHKPRLLALLQTLGLTWNEFYSERLGDTVFFCEDEKTRDALIEAGASQWSVYTKAELRTLVAHNRVKPFTDAELNKVHELKRTLNARIVE